MIKADTIIYEVAKYYDIDPKIIKSSTRKKEISIIRQICMFVIKEVADMSAVKIGEALGGRDHATVIYSIDKVKEEMEKDINYKNKVEDIIANINNMM